MRPPIRRGTARRLGLTPWRLALLVVPKPMTDEQVAEFRHAFEEAARGPVLWLTEEVTFHARRVRSPRRTHPMRRLPRRVRRRQRRL